ncbi:MAG: ExbD/TolR family protein, partial [Polymorphobacter sp.]
DLLGAVYWNNTEVNSATLKSYLKQSAALDPEPELRLHPDAQARYQIVDQVMADAQQAGVTKMGFVGNEAYAN